MILVPITVYFLNPLRKVMGAAKLVLQKNKIKGTPILKLAMVK